MRFKIQNNATAHASVQWRVLAVLMALCLLLSQLSGGFVAAYATNASSATFQVGAAVTAELENGVLTLSGTGDTEDFTAESAPFADYASEIHALSIEEGITYLGAYLLYGLGGLEGELSLPKSIVGFGDYVFSGESFETAPRFATIHNLFESGEVVQSGQIEPDVLGSDYAVEQAVQQEIAHPETLFYEGQTGGVTCSAENVEFLNAALLAGYQQHGAEAEMLEADAQSNEDGAAAAFSQPTSVADVVTTVYVDQTSGADTNTGFTPGTAKQTLDGAAKLLESRANGGTVDNNQIVIVGTYERSTTESDFLKNDPKPVTLTGQGETNACFTVPASETSNDCPLYLYEDFRLKSIQVEKVNHIYGNGYDVTIDDGVVASSGLYLYGFGQSSLSATRKEANLIVRSGRIARISGYVRSNPSVDCKGYSSNITVEGSAQVTMIVAGSASGSISDAAVNIAINGGTVDTLIGGNQGYGNAPSPYTGTTTITMSGGKVTNLLGAGSGRNQSIPTYLGELAIDVKGGTVANLYCAGSAASVTSNESTTSNIAVSVSGGEVNNLFAAGKGWANANLGKDTSGNPAEFVGGAHPDNFGSLTGCATIEVSGAASVGNIYASGEGTHLENNDKTKNNAYLDGQVSIQVNGGTVTGNIYGGGKGIAESGYENCARVTEGSTVEVKIADGTVQGNVYGGGQVADVKGSTSVTLAGGTVVGNIYGGGQAGKVEKATCVNIESGTVGGSVYGGALGSPDAVLVLGGSTVNMTGGLVQGNLYGGSELSDDGAVVAEGVAIPDLIFVNLVGGTVNGNVFGGGYKGTVNGSTHMHIGVGALDACVYYQGNPTKKPLLTASSLSIGGSVYAGGDFGGDGTDYNAITVMGTSHVYIDGTNYDTDKGGANSMILGKAVFGSGASCDAGKTRLVTLKNYGHTTGSGDAVETTRTLTAIQRADRVVLFNSHVQLTGQSDAANTNETALYSLNRIGDHGEVDGGAIKTGLVLQQGSTLILESPATELAALHSLDEDGNEVASDGTSTSPNTLLLDTGTLLRVSYTNQGGQIYGPVKGYARLLAGKAAQGYVYARISPNETSTQDGGFVDQEGTVIGFTSVEDTTPSYRYWTVRGEGGANATREAVLIAQTLESGAVGYGNDYSVAKGVIELLPADRESVYTIKSITVDTGLTLVEAAKSGQTENDEWITSASNNSSGGTSVDLDAQKQAITQNPLTTFGLSIKTGEGFIDNDSDKGKIISQSSIVPNNANTVIGAQAPGKVTNNNVIPQIEFYLTYSNAGITASRDLGTVTVVLERKVGDTTYETTTANVQIVTRTSSLSSLEVDLYATQGGTHAGKLSIPAGVGRRLTLTGVDGGTAGLVPESTPLNGNNFAVSMQAEKNQGWQSAGLMENPCDLGGFAAGASVPIGTTDSRFEAAIEFTLTNAEGFTSKATDVVMLTLTDASDGEKQVSVTLRVHWEESAVTEAVTGIGRQYNNISSATSPAISPQSALTAGFTLSKALSVGDLWLELRNQSGGTVALLADTKLTLLSGAGFYRYHATGAATGTPVKLGDFTSMDGDANLSGTISGNVTVILDFGSSAGMAEAEYSLLLRNEKTADGKEAGFTVKNEPASISLSGGNGLSQGVYAFTLSLSAGSDTRFSEGAAVVLTPSSGDTFPEGTVFTLGNNKYSPSGGKVYIPLAGSGPWSIAMDTTATAGLSTGARTLNAQVFPTGASASNANALSAQVSYDVQQNPAYGLAVSLDSAKSRIVSPGDSLVFTANYSLHDNATAAPKIEVSAQKKTQDGSYQAVAGWTVSGNNALDTSSGTQSITVSVPATLDSGTYRLIFKLGDQEVPYNLIVPD